MDEKWDSRKKENLKQEQLKGDWNDYETFLRGEDKRIDEKYLKERMENNGLS